MSSSCESSIPLSGWIRLSVAGERQISVAGHTVPPMEDVEKSRGCRPNKDCFTLDCEAMNNTSVFVYVPRLRNPHKNSITLILIPELC